MKKEIKLDYQQPLPKDYPKNKKPKLDKFKRVESKKTIVKAKPLKRRKR